jgi:protein-disulfide isomerase
MAIAKQAGFTEESFNSCLQDQKMLEGIEQVRTRASEKLGVNSTPTFFINGKVHRGSLTIEELEKQIAPLLKS